MKLKARNLTIYFLTFCLLFLSAFPYVIGATTIKSSTGSTPISIISFSSNYANDNTIFVGTSGDGIFKSTDGGASWTQLNNGLTGFKNFGITTLATSPNYATDNTVMAGTTDGIFKSSNGGASWSKVNIGNVAQKLATITAITFSPSFAADNTIFAGTSGDLSIAGLTGSGVLKSTDGGNNWTAIINNMTGYQNSFFISTIDLSPNFAVDKTIFAVNFLEGVFKSTDSGTTWQKVNNGVPASSKGLSLALGADISPAFTTDSALFLATYNQGMYKTTDGGNNWTAINTGFPASSLIYSLEISPNYANDSTVLATAADKGIYKTADKGTSWSSINNGLPKRTSYIVKFTPNYATNQTILAGTTDGLYRSTDGGQTWASINNGFVVSTLIDFSAKPVKIKKGKKTQLNGKLINYAGQGVAGKKVVIKAKGKIVATVKTKSDGSFSAKVKPSKTTSYVASFKGSGSIKSSKSGAVKVTVK